MVTKGKVTSMGMNASNKIATFFKYFVLSLVGIIMIYPLLWMVSATFKDNSEIFAGIGLWIKNPTLEGYKNALNNFGGSINILQAMLNTCLLYTSHQWWQPRTGLQARPSGRPGTAPWRSRTARYAGSR